MIPQIVPFARRHLWSGPTRSLADTVGFQGRAFLPRRAHRPDLLRPQRRLGGPRVSRWPELLDVESTAVRWPARWIDTVGLSPGIPLILGGYLVASVVAMMLPERRIARIAYVVMLLQWMALINGFGKVNHDLHGWLFVAAAFVFLPDGGWRHIRSVGERHYFLTVFWAAQVFLLFFYTLTGLWKIVYAVEGLFGPEMSAFEIDGFSYILADRISNTSQDTVVGSFVVRNAWLGWLLFNGTMYLEGASLLIVFRPRLHRIWGLGLILFHAGTQLAMGFTFLPTISLVVLLLVQSPAAPEELSLKAALLDLPGFHLVSRLARSRGAARARGARPRPEPARAPVALDASAHGRQAVDPAGVAEVDRLARTRLHRQDTPWMVVEELVVHHVPASTIERQAAHLAGDDAADQQPSVLPELASLAEGSAGDPVESA